MGCCVIFCAAEFDALARPLENDDYILAADGGLKHTRKLGIEPNEIIGDFDSLGFTPPGAEIFPVEKDDTDAMLAVRRGLELGYWEFVPICYVIWGTVPWLSLWESWHRR